MESTEAKLKRAEELANSLLERGFEKNVEVWRQLRLREIRSLVASAYADLQIVKPMMREAHAIIKRMKARRYHG